ncbi:hypothetical protein MSAN_00964600 [Mycena sanguinolenta]|uniref:NACHT domain-containing protein n=1 Tax=Mycena sanguinolenta TaxID=230812 RepID=A0A8H6YYH5_9AGAR|nr:hypothetical protein MSAN_00964600 [Mycena sanguinolenta]
MKRIHKLLGRSMTRGSSAPPSARIPEPSALSLTTFTRPTSPQTAPAPLPRESRSSTSQTAWTDLKEVLKAVRDGSELYPPFQVALTAVISGMESIDCVEDGTNELAKFADHLKGFQGIFSQYDSQKDISPAMSRNLDAMTLELKLIIQALTSKTQRGRGQVMHTLGNIKGAMNIFRRLNNIIEELESGVGGAGGKSEYGIAGNGGIGQSPILNISGAANCTVNILSTDTLEKLGCIDAATINSQSSEGCLKGTRIELLADLLAWSRDPNSPKIFWLDGMAGTGKSAIARSFCHVLQEQNQLGGSFFCLRGDSNRNNPKHIIPTLAVQLASRDGAYKWALLAAIQKGISQNANLKIQVENLLERPLHSNHNSPLPSMVFVIDALDELDNEDITKELIQRLVSVVPGLAIKLLVTSRPERHIRPHFGTEADLRPVLQLHNIEDKIVKADILLYLTHHLNNIWAENSYPLPGTWACPSDVELLADRAGKLFIYAFTVVEYIREKPWDRLQSLIKMRTDTRGPLTQPLDKIYGHILRESMNLEKHESHEITLTKQILAAVLTVRHPLSVATLGCLLAKSAWQVRETLDRLHAVVHVPKYDDNGVISTFHASFGDFLTTPGRAPDDLLINVSAAQAALFSSCNQIMGSELHFNVSNCPTSYLPNTSQKFTIPAILQYVCMHWPYHLAAVSVTETSDAQTSSYLDCLQDGFFPKFLFWLEVLSALNKAYSASTLIMTALTAKCLAHAPQYITQFLADANEFVVSSIEAVEISVAHIYLSALPCIRPTSQIAKMFCSKLDCVPQVHTAGIQRRQQVRLLLTGHDAGVRCVSFSRDGAYIVSGSDDNAIRVWDTRTGEPFIAPIEGHTDSVCCVAFSPDGTHIASGSYDNTIRVWNAKTGKAAIEPIEGHTDWVRSVAFSPDGTHIASGSDDNTIRVWDAKTGKAAIEPIEGHTSYVRSVAFSPDGTHIASGSADMTIRVWDAKTGKAVIEPIQRHTNQIYSVAFSPDGTHIASGSADMTIRVWDAKTGKAVIEAIKGHTDYVRSVAFSPDGTHIASGSDDNTIRVWDAKTGKAAIEPIEGHTSYVRSVAFSPDGTCLASGSDDNTIRVWDAKTCKAAIEPIEGHTNYVCSVVFSPDGTHIASGSYDNTIRVWDAKTGKAVIEPMQGHSDWVRSVAFSPDGTHIASGSFDKTIRVWDAKTGKAVIEPIEGHTNWIRSVAFSPDGTCIASGSNDKTIGVWDAKTGKAVIEPIQGHTDWVRSVAFSLDGTHIASGSDDKTIRVWDAKTGKAVIAPIKGHTNYIRSVAFSPDGTHIASGSDDWTIRVWNAKTGKAVREPIHGHTDSINSVAFSPDGTHIASGSDDQTIRVWQLKPCETTVQESGSLPVDLCSASISLPHNNDNWIRGPNGELVMWVPPEYQKFLQVKPDLILGGSAKVTVALSRVVHGTDWVKCYVG